MAKKTDTEAPSVGIGLRSKILLVIISFAMIVVFHTGFIFIIVGMLPTIITYYLDQSRTRFRFNTVMACNMSGILPFIHDMIEQGRGNSVITEMMSDITNWLMIYGAAGFGWFLVYITHIIAGILINSFNKSQIARYEALQKRLVEDWGPEVANIFASDKKDDWL